MFLLFLAPFSSGTQKREAAAPKASGALWEGPATFGRNRESRTREAAGRRNWPEAVAQEKERQKKASLPDSTTVGMGGRPNINV
jgi:hypothetical protein